MTGRPNEPATTMTPSTQKFTLDQALVEAIRHHNDGRTAEAENLYRAILASVPGHAVASYGFGLLCAMRGRFKEAVTAYRDAIAMRPDFADAYINLGTVVLALGQLDEAVALYRQAIAISPENALAHSNLGKALQDLGRTDEAIAAYRTAITCQPDNATFHVNFGAALLQREDWNDSITVTRRAIALQSDNAMAHANLGTALLRLGRHEEALTACQQAMALKPESVAIHASLGGAMLELGALPEAIALCRHAITLDPSLADAWFNLSHALKAMNLLEEAEFSARQAIALRPASANYHFHLAHILLLQGNLEAGWVEYDWRWKLPDFSWINDVHGTFSQPLWTGQDIGDKTILTYTEQGLGDIILFARYLPLVKGKAARVIMAVHPPMRRLMETIEGIEIVSVRDLPLPDFDVHCPLLSLPRAFATSLDSIPLEIPYLTADPAERAHWDRRIGGDRLRVGIVWAGNPTTKRDRFRSPGLIAVTPLFSVPGIDFIVLQVGPGREDANASPLPPHVIDLGAEVKDLADTAAIMSGLDLMISSCTAPLHLAGALGVRAWAMIPFAPYFPWLLDRTDTPWYRSVRLYRQERPGQDWSGVVDRIAADLAALARSTLGRASGGPTESARTVTAEGLCPGVASERLDVKGAQMTVFAELPTDVDEFANHQEPAFMMPRPTPHINASTAFNEQKNRITGVYDTGQRDTADVLHVGCGVYTREKLPSVFRAGWREIRLDIDPEVRPDLVASITDMHVIPDGMIDAVYSSHNIEHLYPHEVPLALREVRRVLKSTGFALITLPDLQEVARYVAEGKLEDPLYMSPMGPIAPLDILYGHRPSLAGGNAFMAHRTGFIGETLGAALINAGFAAALVQRNQSAFCLTAVAFRSRPDGEQVTRVQATMLPDADQPAVLYAPED